MNAFSPFAANIQGHSSSREATIAANAIAAMKEAGTVVVAHATTPGFGPGYGYYAHRLHQDGSLGLSIGDVCQTESEAWLSVAIALAVYKPGAVQMTSREFGSTWKANVVCKDGSLGMLERRSRLEIRRVSGQYAVFSVERCYLDGEEPRDVRQLQEGQAFATLPEAAGYVEQFIAGYEGAAADDHEAAVEAQHERDRETFL
jgi:hypothetical protein